MDKESVTLLQKKEKRTEATIDCNGTIIVTETMGHGTTTTTTRIFVDLCSLFNLKLSSLEWIILI
jgi:hypothetical protein